jgi:hypothetical protein
MKIVTHRDQLDSVDTSPESIVVSIETWRSIIHDPKSEPEEVKFAEDMLARLLILIAPENVGPFTSKPEPEPEPKPEQD